MDAPPRDGEGCWAWDPGVGTGIPEAFRDLETIFRPEASTRGRREVEELAGLTGLPAEELVAFTPERLSLHEIIARVTADVAVAEGEHEEQFGRNFRAIATTIAERYVAPRRAEIAALHAAVLADAALLARQTLAETLFAPPPAPPPKPRFPFVLFGRRAPAAPAAESARQREQRVVAGFKTAGLAAVDPLRRAVHKSLYRLLGAIAVRRGGAIADLDLLSGLVAAHVANSWGSQRIGQFIAPLVEAAIAAEGWPRVPNRERPVLISLKGASASGKSSLRPMIKALMREQGIAPDGYATISPDVWRRLLLDYEALGPAHKYAGHLTSRELMVVDGKLDRYIRAKAHRDHAIPHLLVDRFRFDSFATEHIGRVLHETYARYVDTMVMYFIVIPPAETVDRGWQRALERGRYKAVEDFLGHSVEASVGMPKILFKWLAHARPEYRFCFLDNRVPKGSFPKTIASGTQRQMTVFDPAAFVRIERDQKIDLHATSPEAVYPATPELAPQTNTGFLTECVRKIAEVRFVDPATGATYAVARDGRLAVLDAAALAVLARDPDVAAGFAALGETARSGC